LPSGDYLCLACRHGAVSERFDRPPDPHPQEPTIIIAAVEHQVGALRRFKLGVGTVLAD
jgi:hypothetical protein